MHEPDNTPLKDRILLFVANASGYIGEAVLILLLLVLIFSNGKLS